MKRFELTIERTAITKIAFVVKAEGKKEIWDNMQAIVRYIRRQGDISVAVVACKETAESPHEPELWHPTIGEIVAAGRSV